MSVVCWQSHQKFYACSPSPCIAFCRHTTSVLLYYVIQLRKKQALWNNFGQDNGERQYNLNCFSSLSFPLLQLNSENSLQTSSKLHSTNYKTLNTWSCSIYTYYFSTYAHFSPRTFTAKLSLLNLLTTHQTYFIDKLVFHNQNPLTTLSAVKLFLTELCRTQWHLSLCTHLLHTLSLFSQTCLLSLLTFSETPQLHFPTECHASGCGTVEGSCRSNGQVCSSKAMQPRWSSLEEVAESQRSCGLQRMCGSVGDYSTACLVWYGPCLV